MDAPGLKGRLRSTRDERLLAAALLVYGCVLWSLRPLTPFEQDEVLFLKALDNYDVARHSPHPPGYPLYVGIGKAVRWLVRDPDVSLDLVAVAAAVATVAGIWLLARRLGAGRAAATAAAAMAATIPAFIYHAGVGLSDIPGTALALFAALVLTVALDRPGFLPLAGAASAAVCADRPQLLLVILPLGVAALLMAARGRRWGALAGAMGAGIGVSLACWLPAVLVTGPGRFRQSLVDAGRWAADHEANARLPGAPVATVARQWLVAPWGTPALAVAFWLAVAAGCVLWWRSGRRRLVAVAVACGGTYLAAGVFTMGMYEAPRYVLPALPFLALMAGGVLETGGLWTRRAAVAMAAAWCLAAAWWMGPLLIMRSRTPAPVWECLEWVAAHENGSVTTVVYDSAFQPHVVYLLGARGFHLEERRTSVAYTSAVPGGAVVFVTRDPHPPGTVLLRRIWKMAALTPLSRGLYDRCEVTRQPEAVSARFSAEFRVGSGGWELVGAGTVSLPDTAPAQLVRVRAGNGSLALTSAGASRLELPPAAEAIVPLLPGEPGKLRVEAPGGSIGRFPAFELSPVADEDLMWLEHSAGSAEMVVPSASHAHGLMQSDWVTDLVIRNPDPGVPLEVAMRLSQRLDLGGGVVSSRVTVPPQTTVFLRDVVATSFHAGGTGALQMTASRPFTALWRTYDARAPRTLADPMLARPLNGEQRVSEGAFDLAYRPGTGGVRSNVAFFNPSAVAAEVRCELVKRGDSAPLSVRTLRLPPWGFEFLDGDHLVGLEYRKLAADFALRFVATRPVVAYAAAVGNDSNRTRYVYATGSASK